MPRVSDLPTPSSKLKAIIVGAPGSGKTALAGTWPNAAFLDTDKGHTVLQSKWFAKWCKDLEGETRDPFVEVFDDEYDKHGKFKKATAFWDVLEQYNKWITNDEIETIVFDSLTSLSVLAMHVGLEVNKATGKSKTLAQKYAGHPVLLQTMADYGSEMNIVEQAMDQVSGHDKHILVLAHERAETNDAGGTVRIDPLITGSRLRAKIAQWFDEAWYLDVKGSGDRAKRKLTTNSTNKLKFPKSRLGVPDGMEEPHYSKIMKAIS